MGQAFQNVVGQQKVIARLKFLLKAYENDFFLNNIVFFGERGAGKSHLLKTLGKEIALIRKSKNLKTSIINVNSGTLQKVDQFFDQLVLPHFLNVDGVVAIFDEIHAMSKKVEDILLTILDFDSKTLLSSINYQGSTLTFDFRKFHFICATTEPQSISIPFRNRLEEISLETHTNEDLAEILRRNSNFEIKNSAADLTVDFSRGDARIICRWGREIDNYCRVYHRKSFGEDDVEPLMKILNVYPRGLSEKEVLILKHLVKGSLSLRALSSLTKLSPPSQQNFEKYLLRERMIDIDGRRFITGIGVNYLKLIQENWD